MKVRFISNILSVEVMPAERTHPLKIPMLSLAENLDPGHQPLPPLPLAYGVHTNSKPLLSRHRSVRPATCSCRSSLPPRFGLAARVRRGWQSIYVESGVLHHFAEEDVGRAIGTAEDDVEHAGACIGTLSRIRNSSHRRRPG